MRCRVSWQSRSRTRATHLEVPGAGCRASRGEVLFDAAKPEDLDAPLQVGERRIGGNRRLECRQRVGVAVDREESLTASNERRHVIALILEGAVEMRQRLPCVLSGQLEIPERGVSGIETGHHLKRESQLALRTFQIAGLEEDPSPVLSDR